MHPLFPNSALAQPQVKVCGLTRLEDATACAAAGVHAIGINFWSKSKRYHPFAQAAEWLNEVPAGVTRVALFVNASRVEILPILKSGLLDMVQFHGDESDDFLRSFIDDGYHVLRAMSARTAADLEKIAHCPCARIILDAYQPGVYGGSGLTCDWELAAEAVRLFPEKQIILSGGLGPENVAQAIKEVAPVAVDLASGVESAPGVKDAMLIQRLMQAAVLSKH